VVRRTGIGLVSTATPDAADLLGAVVPRRTTIDARPGLAWRCDRGEPVLVQIASGPAPTGRSSDTR
jgi:hypothetical protein